MHDNEIQYSLARHEKTFLEMIKSLKLTKDYFENSFYFKKLSSEERLTEKSKKKSGIWLEIKVRPLRNCKSKLKPINDLIYKCQHSAILT